MIEPIVPDVTEPEDDGQTPLDPDEARGLLPDWVANRADLNLAEEENIAIGMAWGDRARRQRSILTQDFLRDLHRRMFGRVWRWAGQYRDSERNIGVAPHAISSELKKLFDDIEAWDEFISYPLDERAVRLHHRLTVIHPFPNGNGRCARVFADFYLENHSAPPFDWGEGMSQSARRSTYLEAVRAADRHDFRPLLGFARHRK